MQEEFKLARSVELPTIPLVDYRQQIINALDLVGMESVIDELCTEWVAAYQEERAASAELAAVRERWSNAIESVRIAKATEIAEAIKAMGRSTKDERASAESTIVSTDKRVVALAAQVKGAEAFLDDAKSKLVVIAERRKDVHMKYRGRETVADFYRTVAQIPIKNAPDEDGHVSTDESVETEQMQKIRELTEQGYSAAEAVKLSFATQEIRTVFDETHEPEEEVFSVSL